MERFFYQLWYEKKHNIFLIILLPLAAIYYIAWKINDLFYRFFSSAKSLGTFVISIGNVNLGGTGKTPFLLYLLGKLCEDNKKIVVLTRGYGGDREGVVEDRDGFSDEARLVKGNFPDVTVIAGKNRYNNYKKYVKEKPDIVILDDGFQHRKINRNIDIVMIDGKLLFGNGLVFPAGPLREPVASVKKRAHFVVVKDGDEKSLNRLKKMFPEKDITCFKVQKYRITTLSDKELHAEDIKDKVIVAFCGIGNPSSFKDSLEKAGISYQNIIVFGDHVNYRKTDVEKIRHSRADYYITTEKDAVKLNQLWVEKEKLLVLKLVYQLEADWRSLVKT